MVKASPTSAFEMAETDFLLQFEIVPFDAPALFRGVHEMGKRYAEPRHDSGGSGPGVLIRIGEGGVSGALGNREPTLA